MADADTFRTGRFRCTWSRDGRKLTVVDTARVGVQIEAKVTEWLELGEAIGAAVAARALREKGS